MAKKLIIKLPEKLTREYVLHFYYADNGIIKHKRLSKEFFNEHNLQPIVDFLYSEYPDMNDGIEHPITEFLYRIKNNIETYPTCPVCGKSIKKWNGIKKGYKWCCSHECEWSEKGRTFIFSTNNEMYKNKIVDCNSDEDVIKYFINKKGKIKPTIADWNYLEIRQPNVFNYLKNRFEDFKEDYKNHGISELIYRIRHKIETYPKCPVCGNNITQFGCGRNGGYRWICSDRCKKSPQGKNIRAKMSWKDGVCGFLVKDEDGIPKREKTCLKRYGVKCYGILNLSKPEVKAKNNSPEAQRKKYLTAKERGHLGNKSMPEEEIYEFLSKFFTKVERQYTSKEYPFLCDYYIPKFKLYIEYNGTWQHGLDRVNKRPPHPFDENDPLDIDFLKRWTDLKRESAIKRWTVRDVEKRNTAKENNLKYLEIFPKYKTNSNYIYDLINFFIKNDVIKNDFVNDNKLVLDNFINFKHKKHKFDEVISYIKSINFVNFEIINTNTDEAEDVSYEEVNES